VLAARAVIARGLVRATAVVACLAGGASPALAAEADAGAPADGREAGGAAKPGLPPALSGFLDTVARATPAFQRDDYREHGGGSAGPPGFSVDIRLAASKLDPRGFYAPADVLAFLLAVDRAAGDAGARWRALYNDADVAAAVKRRARHGFVQFVGQPRLGQIDLLNYHGPAPLKLHIHLDVTLGGHGQAVNGTTSHSTPPGR
jgi:hypothetical protein